MSREKIEKKHETEKKLFFNKMKTLYKVESFFGKKKSRQTNINSFALKNRMQKTWNWSFHLSHLPFFLYAWMKLKMYSDRFFVSKCLNLIIKEKVAEGQIICYLSAFEGETDWMQNVILWECITFWALSSFEASHFKRLSPEVNLT